MHIINLMCARFEFRVRGWEVGSQFPILGALFWETCLGRSSRSKRRHSVISCGVYVAGEQTRLINYNQLSN